MSSINGFAIAREEGKATGAGAAPSHPVRRRLRSGSGFPNYLTLYTAHVGQLRHKMDVPSLPMHG